MKTIYLSLVLIAIVSSASFAQSGFIEGVVTDSSGVGVRALIESLNTFGGAHTDDNGKFKLPFPAGKHWLYIVSRNRAGYARVSIPNGGVTKLSVVVGDFESPRVKKHGDDVFRDFRQPVMQRGVSPFPSTTLPIRWGDIEYSLRYTLAQDGDSVLVNVIAEGRNTSKKARAVCGYFSMWTSYGPSPDLFVTEGDMARLRYPEEPGMPRLKVRGINTSSPVLDCKAVTLAPGECIERGMAFRFDPKTFEKWTGVLTVKALFNYGRSGDRWENTDCVAVGGIYVPIRPIGQPMLDN